MLALHSFSSLVNSARTSSVTTLLSAALLLFGFLYIIWAAAAWYRLRHIPGPKLNALTRLWLIRSFAKGTFYTDLRALGDKYGDLTRVGPNELYSSDIDVLQRLSSPKSAYTRGGWYRTFRFIPTQDNTFSLLDDTAHTELRQRIAKGFSTTNDIEDRIDKQLLRLMRLIDTKFVSAEKQPRAVDFSLAPFKFALDCIGDISFDQPFGFLDEGEDVHGYIHWFEGFFQAAMCLSVWPTLVEWIQATPLANLMYRDTDTRGIGCFVRMTRETVQRKYQTEKKQGMLGIFQSNGVSATQALNELLLQIVAGSDSSANCIRMSLLYTITHADVLAKVRAEIDEAHAAGRLSTPVKEAESRSLPYLQAVLKESIRVFPAVVAPFYKKVPAGGDMISGFHVPEGTLVGVNAIGVLRSKKYWGEGADVFRPERWFEAEPAQLERMSAALEVMFGYGRYKCLGRFIGMSELNKAVPELLRRYEFSVVNSHEPIKIINAGFFMMSDFWLTIRKREQA